MMKLFVLVLLAVLSIATAFAPMRQFGRSVTTSVNMADGKISGIVAYIPPFPLEVQNFKIDFDHNLVEIVFPNGKKTKAASGSSLKEGK
jgi:hypothetical protein